MRMRRNPAEYTVGGLRSGFRERKLGSGVGRAAPVGTERSAAEIFLAGAAPDLPALRGDIRAGRVAPPKPAPKSVGAAIQEIETDMRTLRAKVGREDPPSEHDIKLLIELAEEVSKLYATQAAEAKAALALAAQPESRERKRYVFLREVRYMIHEALLDAAPLVDHLQFELAQPGMEAPRTGKRRLPGDLDDRDRAELLGVAKDLEEVSEAASNRLRGFLIAVGAEDIGRPKGEAMSDGEKSRIQEAIGWLDLASDSFRAVQATDMEGVSETVMKFFTDLMTEEGVEEEEAITDQSVFAALVKGIRDLARSRDKIFSATTYGGTKFVEGAMEIPKTSVGFAKNPGGPGRGLPLCCADL